MREIGRSLRALLWMTLLTGVAYPLLISGIAWLTLQQKADGGFITVQGKTVGAALIGQKFTENKYFWGRPSATDYSPLPSGGSNLSPTSAALRKAVEERRAHILQAHGDVHPSDIPAELLYASGSGLDPHISPATAQFQIGRIVKARNLDQEKGSAQVEDLIRQRTARPLFGPPIINLLELNTALDEITLSISGKTTS